MYKKHSYMRKVMGQLSAVLLFLYSIPCFRNETYKLYKKFLKETCSSKSTNIQQHIEESTEWKMVQNFMVAVSI